MATLSRVTNVHGHDLWGESWLRCRLQRPVASKIARINIRARHCHSVNFPRCWLCRVGTGWVHRRGVGSVGEARGELGYNAGKTQISLPLMEFYAFRALDGALHVVGLHFRCARPPTPSTVSPLRATSMVRRCAPVTRARPCENETKKTRGRGEEENTTK